MNYYNEILDYTKSLYIIDTHQHLPVKESERNMNADFISEYFSQYIQDDMISCGYPKNKYQELFDVTVPIKERWRKIEPYFNFTKHSAYARIIFETIKGLYGVEELNEDTIEELDEKFKQSVKEGSFTKVLKEKSKIAISITDPFCFPEEIDESLFVSTFHIDEYIGLYLLSQLKILEKKVGFTINSFDSYLDAVKAWFKEVITVRGFRVLKMGLAYTRSLHFKNVTREVAEEIFNNEYKKACQKSGIEADPPLELYYGNEFQDYMMHFIMQEVSNYDVVVQIHTGIQAGNGNYLMNSNPALLANLFLQYPNVKFDLFHISYPFQSVAATLAKNCPNVYIDMCWAHIISPYVSVKALIEFIDTVPLNKVMAFGGDLITVDCVYGHQKIARENVSKSLAYFVEEGRFSLERAKEISKMLFFDNPVKLFKLEDKVKGINNG